MKTNEQKAFDFAADTTKQLITLATGIIALTITFSKDIIGASQLSNSSLIFWSWGLFIFSIICGIWTLMALTGNLQPMKKKTNEIEKTEDQKVEEIITEECEINININTNNVKIPSVVQILSFIIALIFTVLFGINSIKNSNNKNDSNEESIEVIKKTEYQIVEPKKTEKLTFKRE
ncbi:hypothetical protein [Flavobacterium maritimum]|uniref:hypothetical protein n=1 Tax=Flavobacterium maritimum TaxID=3149042 RepID=UPI0032B5F85D